MVKQDKLDAESEQFMRNYSIKRMERHKGEDAAGLSRCSASLSLFELPLASCAITLHAPPNPTPRIGGPARAEDVLRLVHSARR